MKSCHGKQQTGAGIRSGPRPAPAWPEKGKRGHHLSYPSSILVKRWLEASPFGHFLRELRVDEVGSLTSPLPPKAYTSGSHSSWFLIFNSQPLPDGISVPAVVIESRPPITMARGGGRASKLSECSRPWFLAAAAPQCMRQRNSRSQLRKPHKQVRQVRARLS